MLNMTSVECEFVQTTGLDCSQPFFASGVTFVSFGVRYFCHPKSCDFLVYAMQMENMIIWSVFSTRYCLLRCPPM